MMRSTIVNKHGQPYRMSSHYEGASPKVRMSSLFASSAGPNTAIYSSISTLRNRSRQLIRNNALASGAAETFVSNVVGSGITPRFQIQDTEIKKSVQTLWADSVSEFDYDGVLDFYGLQGLVAHALFDAGECLVIFKPMRKSSGLAVPLQIQIVEADHLDEAYSTVLPNGHSVKMGIEYDAKGKRCAYWLWKNHPGESSITTGGEANERIRIPARNCLHIFDPLRPGQQRGRPRLSSIIVKLHDIDQCVDAELMRRKTTAMFGGFFTRPPEEDANPTDFFGKRATDDDGYEIPSLEPATFVELPHGMDVTFSEPKDVTGNYINWMKQQLMDVARGIGITYEQLTGDLDGVTYGSIRAGLLEFRRSCEKLQKHILIYKYCKPVVERWLDAAFMSMAIDIPDYVMNVRGYRRSVAWQPQPWKWIDPSKDIKGELDEIRGGLKSRSQSLSERGLDIENHDEEIAADNARADKLGLVFDSDARHDTKNIQTEGENGKQDE